jgi:hypothetical protein
LEPARRAAGAAATREAGAGESSATAEPPRAEALGAEATGGVVAKAVAPCVRGAAVFAEVLDRLSKPESSGRVSAGTTAGAATTLVTVVGARVGAGVLATGAGEASVGEGTDRSGLFTLTG